MTRHNCKVNEELKCHEKDIKESYLAIIKYMFFTAPEE